MKNAIKFGGLYYVIALIVIYFLPIFYTEYKSDREQRAEIYYVYPESVVWKRIKPDILVFSALATKLKRDPILPLPNCAVIKGSTISISASWKKPNSGFVTRSYEATRDTGELVTASPQVSGGEQFVVGPFKIVEKDVELFNSAVDVKVHLNCEFPSGLKREATIGPMSIDAFDNQ